MAENLPSVSIPHDVLETVLRLFCPFSWFKMDSYQLLAKEYAQVLVESLED